jgi:hypothetical protein
MQLDVRLPVGLMLGIMGLLLAVHGLVADPSINTKSLGVNINLVWGLVLVAVSMCLLALSKRRSV